MTKRHRLRVLYNYLMSGAVIKREFDMGDWPTCAVGEGSRIPSLAKDGLALDDDLVPVYDGARSFGAVSLFFGVDYATAEKVFGPKRRSLAKVVSQIRRLLVK